MNIEPSVILTCGSGGVGKTTLSAALGLKLATEGLKVIVLTIDPARRLATSLGLNSLDDEPKQIDLPKTAKGELWAMMLDTKRTFDRLIEKYAPNDEAAEKIHTNKLYQHMSNMLSGTQEYMAMERLFEIYLDSPYEVIIVDTPPMQNAKDFLAAPQKMMNMINNSMLQTLLKPTMSLGKKGFSLFGQSSKAILKVFDRITGFEFLQDISEMLIAFQGLLDGFQNRADHVHRLLKSEKTKFHMVCTTQEHSISEIKDFSKQLDDLKYSISDIIVNRVYTGKTLSVTKQKTLLDKSKTDKENTQTLLNNYNRFAPLIKNDQKQIKNIQNISKQMKVHSIPLFLSDVHDLKSLKMIADALDDYELAV